MVERRILQGLQFVGGPAADLERDGLGAGKPHAFKPNQAGGGRDAQSGGNFVFATDDFAGNSAGMRGEAEAGHLLGVCEELVEVHFWRCYEGAGAATPLNNSVAGQLGDGMARGHETHAVDLVRSLSEGIGSPGFKRLDSIS